MSEPPILIPIKDDDNNAIKAVFYSILAFNIVFKLGSNIQHDISSVVTIFSAVDRSTDAAYVAYSDVEYVDLGANSASSAARFEEDTNLATIAENVNNTAAVIDIKYDGNIKNAVLSLLKTYYLLKSMIFIQTI